MNDRQRERYAFALEVACFELERVRQMAAVEGRLQIATSIADRIEDLEELDGKIQRGDIIDRKETYE
jgi:hypothetical protein